ncbi:MAG: ATP-binding protein [Gammaproteobacteria bacterium]|nr:ATP-binding protein [Gammaproteobacteria bacterium]
MKQIAIISGKGGTGKTILAGACAALTQNKILVDCDVDAADLHLLLHPTIKEQHPFKGGAKAVIDPKICIKCGQCLSICRFEAIQEKNQTKNFIVDPILCEGCGFCSHICPVNAISMQEHIDGYWFISDTQYGTFVHAQLGIGEGNSGKLVSFIRQKAEEMAKKQNADWIIIDGPPGIGCPTIAATTNTDLAVIVTEPTLSGIHDLQRVLKLVQQLGIPAHVIINKYDLNLKNSQKIKQTCLKAKISYIGEIPYTREIPQAIAQGKIITEYLPKNSILVNTFKNIIDATFGVRHQKLHH